MNTEPKNHYEWLDLYFGRVLDIFGLDREQYAGLIVADGDKCYQYQDEWEEDEIHFYHGAALYLISKTKIFDSPEWGSYPSHMKAEWVSAVYRRVKDQLPPVTKTKRFVWLNTVTGEFSNSWTSDQYEGVITIEELLKHHPNDSISTWKLIEYVCHSDYTFEFNKNTRLR